MEWLVDDSADWPPPKPQQIPTPASMSDGALMFEVARRHRIAMLRLLQGIEIAEKVDWCKLVYRAEPLPESLRRVIFIMRFAGEFTGLYDPEATAAMFHQEMPGRDYPPSTFTRILRRAYHLNENTHYKYIEDRVLGAANKEDKFEEEMNKTFDRDSFKIPLELDPSLPLLPRSSEAATPPPILIGSNEAPLRDSSPPAPPPALPLARTSQLKKSSALSSPSAAPASSPRSPPPAPPPRPVKKTGKAKKSHALDDQKHSL